VIDDEVRVGIRGGNRADVRRYVVSRVEAGNRQPLVDAEQRHAERDALLDDGDAGIGVVDEKPAAARTPRGIELPRRNAGLASRPFHDRELILDAGRIIRKDHRVVQEPPRPRHLVDDVT
jgi:hypothetical protein